MSNKFKGKKIDHEFVSEFIQKCVKENKKTSKEIVLEAKEIIKKIDKQLIKINELKKKRSKLLDVIGSFDEKLD